MRKYHWNDAKLQKKAQQLDWLALGFGAVMLVMYFVGVEPLVLLMFLAPIAMCFYYSWRLRKKDFQSKDGDKRR